MTGKNPGKHGLYDFLARRSGDYRTRPFNASQRDAISLWQLLSRAEKRVVALNVPMTYPPEPIRGLMVSGMGTPATAEDYCYPEDLLPELRQAVPNYEVLDEQIYDPRGRESQMLEAVREMTAMRQQAVLHFLDHTEWDFFMAVFMATDWLQHYFWHYMDASHPRHDPNAPSQLKNAILDCYRQLDDGLREILERLGEDNYVILMSDHGFGPQEKYLHVNTWLRQTGFLHFKRTPLVQSKEALFRAGFTPLNIYEILRHLRQSGTVAQNLRQHKEGVREIINRLFLSFKDVDWQRTRAYSVGNIGPIYVNLKGREPQGAVEPGQEYEDLLAELTDALARLNDPRTGARIVEQILRREDIFHGSHLSEAPDLLFLPRDSKYTGYGLLQFSTNDWLADSDRSGGHRMDGMLIASGPGVRASHELSSARIIDLAPTILAIMGVPIPEDMDGQILTDAFIPDTQVDLQVGYQKPQHNVLAGSADLSEQAEDEILDRLRGLGYVE
jgi:predicted AlkP superfamily phosphohydrolase/phosphomutase